jgi:arylformamidase
MKENSEWIDVSVPIYSGMVHWPGDPSIEVSHLLHLDRGDPATVSQLSLGTHTGTHVDAPNHFIRNETGVDSIPTDSILGPARVIELLEVSEVTPEDLKRQHLQEGERILLKTSNSARCWNSNEFVRDFVPVTLEAAQLLAQVGIRTVGVDYLSIGKGDHGPAVHRALLESNICIIEGLNLSRVSKGVYEMACLPLRVRDGDGAPARAFLKKIAGKDVLK